MSVLIKSLHLESPSDYTLEKLFGAQLISDAGRVLGRPISDDLNCVTDF